MRQLALILVLLTGLIAAPAQAATPEQDIGVVLDALHAAADKADGPAYFALYTPDATYLGTDAGERWTLEQFRGYAMPYFAKGQG